MTVSGIWISIDELYSLNFPHKLRKPKTLKKIDASLHLLIVEGCICFLYLSVMSLVFVIYPYCSEKYFLQSSIVIRALFFAAMGRNF